MAFTSVLFKDIVNADLASEAIQEGKMLWVKDTYRIYLDVDASTRALMYEGVENGLAEPYDSGSTYSIGQLVIHNGILYKNTTAITTPEAWDINHWNTTNLEDIIGILGGLNTSEKGTIVGAINELDSEITTANNEITTINNTIDNNISYNTSFGTSGQIWFEEISKTIHFNTYINGTFPNGTLIGSIVLPHTITASFTMWFNANVTGYGFIPCSISVSTSGEIRIYATQNADIIDPTFDVALYIGGNIA